MTCVEIGLEQQKVIIRFVFTKFRGKFGGFPIRHTRVIKSPCQKDMRIVCRTDVVVWRIGEHIIIMILVGSISPFIIFERGKWNAWITDRIDNVHKGYFSDDGLE